MHYQGTMGQIDNCIIENNQKDGIAVWTAAAIDIENSIVRNNGLNGWGNGLSIWSSYARISNSKIENLPRLEHAIRPQANASQDSNPNIR